MNKIAAAKKEYRCVNPEKPMMLDNLQVIGFAERVLADQFCERQRLRDIPWKVSELIGFFEVKTGAGIFRYTARGSRIDTGDAGIVTDAQVYSSQDFLASDIKQVALVLRDDQELYRSEIEIDCIIMAMEAEIYEPAAKAEPIQIAQETERLLRHVRELMSKGFGLQVQEMARKKLGALYYGSLVQATA